jgi:MraZ protein
MLVIQKDHLALYAASEWADFEQRLRESSKLDPDAERLRRFYAPGTVPSAIDSQGRILVPGFLREHANLDKEVIVAGVFDYVEIWNPAKFEASQAETMHELDDIKRMVDQRQRS